MGLGVEYIVGLVAVFVVMAWCHAFCVDDNMGKGGTAKLRQDIIGVTLDEWRSRASRWMLSTAGLYTASHQRGGRRNGMREAVAASSRIFESRGEKLTRNILEQEFFPGSVFSSVRPNWLKNPATGRNLELDCYNERMRLAVEIHGKQHYEQVPIMHGHGEEGLRKFHDGQRRDMLKRTLCARRGVRLIEVPYTETTSREKCIVFLREKLDSSGLMADDDQKI